MRIQLLSDLHLEFHRDGGAALLASIPVAGDVLVLAGDVLPLAQPEFARGALEAICARFPEVVFVAGNHEYYRTSPARAHEALAAASEGLGNLHVLDGTTAVIGGQRFVGATLWFPPTDDEELYRAFVNDFEAIAGFVPWVHETHAKHLAFLEETVHPGDVVVTHHLPHPRSVSPLYREAPSNRFFLARDAAPLVGAGGAALWIHGHTHTSADYVEGRTRVVCNPVGYPGERKTPADPAFCVEVPAATR